MRISQKLLQLRNISRRNLVLGLALAIPFSLLVVTSLGRLVASSQTSSASMSPTGFVPVLAAIVGISTMVALFLFRARTRDDGKDAPRSVVIGQSQLDANEASVAIAKRYEQQTRAMSALSELDRAILSRANDDRLVDCILRNAPQVLNCPLVAITLIDGDETTQCRTIFVHADNPRNAQSMDFQIREETTQFLAAHPDGCSLDSSHDNGFLMPLFGRGAQHIFLLPVYWEGSVAAVLAFGLIERDALSSDEQTYARDFADRMGVALRSSALEDKVKMHVQLDLATALLNRTSFKDRLSQEIGRAQRESRQIALLFIDLDQFKKVNDSIGHAGGDILLEQASQRLRNCLREEDVVARFGGDDFAVLLPALSKGMDAAIVAQKLINQLSEPFIFEEKEYRISASIGGCICPDDGLSVDGLFRSADIAMYRAKSQGGGQFAFFEQHILSKIRDRATLETDLREALVQDELQLFYQPQIDLHSGKIIGAEALLRWTNSERGPVKPEDFISVAEQCGLIEQIGEYSRANACRQYRTWEDGGVAPLRVAVNISSSELANSDFVPRFSALMNESGVRPYSLEFEITESLFLDNSEVVKNALSWLHERGIHIAIDDFGTGYSSIAYLKRLPFDTLKLDRSFVKDIGTGDGSDELVQAILGIAKSLGKSVLAEGVETVEQRDFLARNGCDAGQGFLWSEALPPAEFETFCQRWTGSPSR